MNMFSRCNSFRYRRYYSSPLTIVRTIQALYLYVFETVRQRIISPQFYLFQTKLTISDFQRKLTLNGAIN